MNFGGDFGPTFSWDHSIRAVLLDAVGTTIVPITRVSHNYWVFGQRHGSRIEAVEINGRFLKAVQHEDDADRLAGYLTSEARELERWERIVGSVFSDVIPCKPLFQELWEYYRQPSSWSVFPGAMKLVDELISHGVQVVLASNFDGRLRDIVKGMPELRAIQKLAISSEIGWRKPAREFFEKVLAQLQLQPEEVMVVGDDLENDYYGPRAAGLHARLVERSSIKD